jgi:cytochrome oxidase Cu insertion factor (SCO1/SenC/PrrC family)
VKSLAVKIWLSVLLLLVAAYAAYTGVNMLNRRAALNNPKSNLDLKPTRHLSEFEFTERDGRKVRFADLEGKVVVFNFFFANCPGTCRILNQKVADLHKEFGPQGVRFVSVTIDPSSDTPEQLKRYAEPFRPDENWWFVTGPLEHTQELALSLRLTAVGRDAAGLPTHTDEIVVLDRAGKIRGAFDHGSPIKMTAAADKIRELLAEKAPPAGSAPASSNSSPTASPTPSPSASPTPSPSASPSPSAAAS